MARNDAIRHHPWAFGSNASRLDFEMNEELMVTPPGAKLIEDFVNTNELDEPDGAHSVREALRKLLLANNGAPLDPDAVGTLNSAAERSRLRVSFSPNGHAELVPDEPDVPGALSRILAVAYTAMADESWTRLKACRLDDCQWAF